jgi:hypothetical protein
MNIRVTHAPSHAAWQAAVDALLVRAQAPLARFDARTGRPIVDNRGRLVLRSASTDALSLAGAPLCDLIAWYLRAIGSPALRDRLARMRRSELVALACSRSKLSRLFGRIRPQGVVLGSTVTGDVPGLLTDSLNKITATLYAEARRTWRAWARRIDVDTFDAIAAVRIEDFDNLPEVPAGADIEFHTLRDSREQFTLATYARGVKITRQTLLNDDMGAIASVPVAFVNAAARVEDGLAYAALEANANMADGNALFSTAHANTTTGALTATTYGAARAKLARQTTPGGDVLDLVGSRLIVPPEQVGVAEGVLAESARVERALDESPSLLVESPHLSNTTQWYLSTDPRFQPAALVAFLRDEPGPTIHERIDFDTDGFAVKCRHQVAAAAVDHRAIVRSSGV